MSDPAVRSWPHLKAANVVSSVPSQLHTQFLIWWYWLRWWSPEARAYREMRRYGGPVAMTVARLSQAPEAEVEAAVQQAFLALHRRYVRGRDVRNVRLWTARYALTIMAQRRH